MRVLLLGAYGFIGSAIGRELASRGHQVTGVGRDIKFGKRILPHLNWVTADFAEMTTVESWKPLLSEVDAVVNASGLLQSGAGGSVEAVQLHAVVALAAALEASSAKRLVQISAVGAHPEATSEFMSTKGRADAAIQSTRVPSIIVRPGLVIGRDSFGGTELIRIVACLPVNFRFPFSAAVQCTALDDVVDAVTRALEAARLKTGCFDLVERQSRSLQSVIATHKEWLGFPPPGFSITIPGWVLRTISGAADLLGHFGWRSPLRRNAMLALSSGVFGNAEDSAALLGREPWSLELVLSKHPAGKQDRVYARVALVLPLLLGALFIMWAISGATTLLQVDRAAAVFQPSGIGHSAARALALGGAWVDLILAFALLYRSTVRAALLAMVFVTLAYVLGATLLLPGLWADPLAPLAKALPACLLALVGYWMLERR